MVKSPVWRLCTKLACPDQPRYGAAIQLIEVIIMSDDYHNVSFFRATFTRVLLGAILLSSVAALVLTGNGSVLRDNIGGEDVAKIGDKTISVQEFSQIYSRRIAQNGITDDMARKVGVPQMILQSEIEHETMLQAAKKLGIRIDDKYIADQLMKQLDQVKLDGTPKEKLQIILQQQKMTEKDLVDSLRGDFGLNVLANTVTTNDIQVPPSLLLATYQTKKQERSAQLIAVTPDILKDKKPLTNDQVQAFYKENNNTYRVEEKRNITALILPQKLFIKDVTISDADADKYFKDHAQQFLSPERVELEQVIFPTEDAANKAIAAKPADLSTYKDQQYLKSDWYGKNTLPKEFVSAIYPAKPNGLIGPIKTSLGWHVVNVTKYEDAKPMTMEEARPVIVRQMKDAKIDEQMTAATNELDGMISQGSGFNAIAKKYELKTIPVADLQAKTIGEQLKDTAIPTSVQQRILDAIFTLQEGEVSPMMDTTGGDNVLVQVTKITPSAIPEFKAIEAKVRKDAETTAMNKALLNKAEELVGTFDVKNPAAFDKAVAQAGLKPTALAAMDKTETEKSQDKQMADLLFTLAPDNALSYVQYPNKVVLVRLNKIIQSKDKPDAKTMDELKDAVKTSMVQELQQQFLQAWQKELTIRVNTGLMQSAFGPQSKEQQQ
jgi:peptidyl-prolyl cis-trans isomerase D